MAANSLSAMLAVLTAQLEATRKDQQESLAQLQETVAQALLTQGVDSIGHQELLLERSDLLFSSNLGSELEKTDRILERVVKLQQNSLSDARLFVRNLPVRTQQLAGGVAPQAAGARVTSFGPFTNRITGRSIYFEIAKIKKLLPLYIQGQSEPAVLFSAEFSVTVVPVVIGTPEITRSYEVVPDTVWISARLFDPAAAGGLYLGLRVKGGSIVLDNDPFLDSGKLTVSAITKVACNFELEQNDGFASDAASPFGIDARQANFQLPTSFSFTIQAQTKTITAISESTWQVYGQQSRFIFQGDQTCVYNPLLGRLCIPLHCTDPSFSVTNCQSPFYQLNGNTEITRSWWGIPVASIDITAPLEADGNGALIAQCQAGLSASWQKLEGHPLRLLQPFIIGEPGRIGITDLTANASGASQNYFLWQDEVNAFGSNMQLQFNPSTWFLFNTLAKGDEVLACNCNADIACDRPVQVNGHAVPVRSKNSLLILAVSKHRKLLSLLDENMLWDNKLPAEKIPKVKPMALAMHNALFTVTPPNGVVVFAEINDDYSALQNGKLFLYFGMFSYLPTLPDPYAANLGVLDRQFAPVDGNNDGGFKAAPRGQISTWLIGLVQWQQRADQNDSVGVSFHLAALQARLDIERAANSSFNDVTTQPSAGVGMTLQPTATTVGTAAGVVLGNRQIFGRLEDFALIDVSSKANQMGVAFSSRGVGLQQILAREYKIDIQDDENASVFPVQIRGLDVVTIGQRAQAFTVPQISWEPVLNFTAPECLPGSSIPDIENPDLPVGATPPYDPPIGWNYYQNDGLPTRIGNLSRELVTLSPIPMAKYLVNCYRNQIDGRTYALFNLPFGMLALAFLNSGKPAEQKSTIENIAPVFDNYVIGGMQFELAGGISVNKDEGRLFEGLTVQLHNVNNVAGINAQYTTLAHSPDIIFNGEFGQLGNVPPGRPAVPLEKIGLSGYGASTFSNWENKQALFAQTSQAFFNVVTGRTSREVIQVKSMVYPWGIRVVRTITLFRMGNGYVARFDSGWQAQSDGLFDFRYPVSDSTSAQVPKPTIENPHEGPFSIHPGALRGLRAVRNIHEIPKTAEFQTSVNYLWQDDGAGNPIPAGAASLKTANLQAIRFDCDVEIDNVVEGGDNNRVTSKGVIGYVQLQPTGAPINAKALKELLIFENNSIGGPINCTIKVAGTQQRMRLNRFDINTSQDAVGNPVFAAALRGAVVLPKDGSWTLVQHNRGSGDVTPMQDNLGVPLIADSEINVLTNEFPNVANIVQRFAYPNDLLKAPDAQTINFGFLQNMNTQKVLFLTPAFKQGVESLITKTPPLLADAYRLMNTSSVFPNIGDAESNLGTAIQLLKGVDATGAAVEAFAKTNVTDNIGNPLYEVLALHTREEAGKLLDQGYKLIKAKGNAALDKALRFDLPAFEYPLVNLEDILKIYVEYETTSDPKNAAQKYIGKFDFDIDSFANDLADTWKGKMQNLSMVVDLGPLKRLMTIKGNFNSQKGQEVDYGGDSSGVNLPVPEIEFSDAVEAVIKILEILEALSTGKYADALKKGLKIAMSNSANLWEYKFEATKEIALVRFPPEPNLYEAPTTPLKLEASMSLGVYFNAALKVTSDPKQLLPTAGAFFKFHGGLQVMCVSLAAATVYAVGSADLTLRADTSPVISLTMKFGFGAQITVGLPVIANVSVLYMVGVEVYLDSNQTVIVTAFLLFRGHAEILGGIVGVTISIEAQGSIEKLPGPNQPCNCKAKVTFGLDISIFLVINLSFSESWEETRQIA